MCFWNCLARHYDSKLMRAYELKNNSLELYESYYKCKDITHYVGIGYEELTNEKVHFEDDINVYRYNGIKAYMIRHSKMNYQSTMNLNIYNDLTTNKHHFSFIKTIHNLISVFQCPDCKTFLSEFKKLKPTLLFVTMVIQRLFT